MTNEAFDIDDKLSYSIFSILESNFLNPPPPSPKIRILSIDAAVSDNAVLAALSLSRLESLLRKHSRNPSARLADFFDLAAASGPASLFALMLFSSTPCPADNLLRLAVKNSRNKNNSFSLLRRMLFCRCRRRHRSRDNNINYYHKIFSNQTFRDTVKPVLVPCYDMRTESVFTFSRSDAVESEEYDYLLRDVCAAATGKGNVEVRSVDGRGRVKGVGGGVGTGNPTAAAITHVLNNKREFPGVEGVEDLFVVSLGSARMGSGGGKVGKIAGEAAVDQVDQSVAMAFGEYCSTNYVRIQANGLTKVAENGDLVSAAEAVLSQRNIVSIMFQGKKVSDLTNGEKLEWVSGELIKEQERRQRSNIPTVMIKTCSGSGCGNNTKDMIHQPPLQLVAPSHQLPTSESSP